KALKGGFEAFRKGSAIEAVIEAISIMEDSGFFNAGVGSVKNSIGEVEMDAGIMHGNSYSVGAVAVCRVRNPIKLAYEVLRQGRHVIMAGIKREEISCKGEVEEGSNTVGAVALDEEGNLVAGTSTGGVKGKLPGRIGDSPIPGAGFYATQNVAVSSTGIGEVILKILPAKEVDILVSMGYDIKSALNAVVMKVTRIFGSGNIGMIGIDRFGNIGAAYNTIGMARGVMDKDNVKIYIFEGEF
ncbi:MAG: isoaspartyl peptidase/L-asparaginase, partial [Sulfolobales archaeon]